MVLGQTFLSFLSVKPPKLRSIKQLNVAVGYTNMHGMLGLSRNNKTVEAGALHHDAESTAAVGRRHAAAEHVFKGDIKAARRGRTRAV